MQLYEDVHSASVPPDRNKRREEKEERLMHIKGLEKQLMREEEAKQCVMCMDKSRQVMIRPCNHYCVCEECIKQVPHLQQLYQEA